MSDFLKIEKFILHENYDYSFWFNGYTAYAIAEYEGVSGMARNFPAGSALYLIDEKISFKKEDCLNKLQLKEILHNDGTKAFLRTEPKFILRYRDYINESMFRQYNDNSLINVQTATEYSIRRNKELKDALKPWERRAQIDAELILLYWSKKSLAEKEG